MGRRLRRDRNDAGSMLAATFVIAAGAGCTIFLLLAMSPGDSMWPTVAVGGGTLALLIGVALVRFGGVPHLGLDFWSLRFRSHRQEGAGSDYLPRIRKPRNRHGGANQPITAEQARELNQSSGSTWVPSRHSDD